MEKLKTITRIGIVAGALLLTTASGCKTSGEYAELRREASHPPTAEEMLNMNLNLLVKHATENKSKQWRRDNLTSGIPEYILKYNNLYLCLSVSDGKFYSVNFEGLKPYTANPVNFLYTFEGRKGFSYNERTKEGKLVFKASDQSSREIIDKAIQAELSVIGWIRRTQLTSR